MIIRRKYISNKADNPNNDWDVEIEREHHETIEENGNLVIDGRKKYMYLITKKAII